MKAREMISLRNLTHSVIKDDSFVPVLKDVNLEVGQGEIFGIIGRDNLSKTALMRCINLLDRPTSGITIVDRQNLTVMESNELRRARANIGYITPNTSFISSKTIRENIALPLEIAGYSKNEISSILKPILDFTGLTQKQNYYPKHLTICEQRKAQVARSLVNKPKAMLVSDITKGLDPKSAKSIFNLIKDLNKAFNVTILMITNDIDVIKFLCDRIGFLQDGKIVEQGNIVDIFTSPKSKTAKEFIASVTRQDLPNSYRKTLVGKQTEFTVPLYRIASSGVDVQEEILSHVIQAYGININIIQAQREVLADTEVRVIIAEFSGLQYALTASIQFLNDNNLHVEVLGYVPRAS